MKVKLIKKELKHYVNPYIYISGLFLFLIFIILAILTENLLLYIPIACAVFLVSYVLSSLLGKSEEVKHVEEAEIITEEVITHDGRVMQKGDDGFLYFNGEKYKGKDGRFVRIVK